MNEHNKSTSYWSLISYPFGILASPEQEKYLKMNIQIAYHKQVHSYSKKLTMELILTIFIYKYV